MSKSRNPARRCRICGGRTKSNMRFCPLCARDRAAPPAAAHTTTHTIHTTRT